MDFITISVLSGLGWNAGKGVDGWADGPFPNDMSRLKAATTKKTEIIPGLTLSKYFAVTGIAPWGLRPNGTHNPPWLFRPAASEDPQLVSETYEEDVRYGSRAEFVAAQKSGEILLRPRRAIRLRAEDRLIPNSSCVLQWTHQPLAGFSSYEAAKQRGPGYWTWLESDGAIPGWNGPVYFCSGDMSHINAGRYFGAVRLEHWRGTPGTVFTTYGRPDFSAFVKAIDAISPPINLKAKALDENFGGVMDLLTEVAEAPETVRYLYDSLKRIVTLYLDTRKKVKNLTTAYHKQPKGKNKRKKVSNKEFVDEIAALWMQFRYAATPIGYSIEDALALLESRPLSYVTTRKREDTPFSGTFNGLEYKCSVEHRYFVKSRVKLTSASLYRTSFVKTLYELTPLSFVVDWVFPLGQLLGSLDVPKHADQVAVLYSKRVRSLDISQIGYVECDYYVAQTTNEIPDGIGFDVNLSFKRVIDSLALTWSLFLKQHWKS